MIGLQPPATDFRSFFVHVLGGDRASEVFEANLSQDESEGLQWSKVNASENSPELEILSTSDLHWAVDSGQPSPVFLGYPHGPKTGDWVPTGRTTQTVVGGPNSPASATVILNREWSSDGHFVSTSSSGYPVSAFGPATSGLDNAFYSRSSDCLVEIIGADVKTSYDKEGRATFKLDKGQWKISILPHFYRNHLGYFLWGPTGKLWPNPIAGWCSWSAYGQDVDEKKMMAAAKFFSKNLKEYGYDVIQMDDGFQRVSQFPTDDARIAEPFSHYWTIPNSKFPSGLEALAHFITGQGLTAGIWLGAYLPLGLKHESDYVQDEDGRPQKGPWVGYAMSPYDPAAVSEAYTDTIKAWKAMGWTYFKIDTLRHILYDSYRKVPQYWAKKGVDSSTAYRLLVSQIGKAIGPKDYFLACWGTLPELAGLPNGCRIGEDVSPDIDSMARTAKYVAQFHLLNGVLWKNDPDYMCMRVPLEQARTWATMQALAGGQVMVSDPVETYDQDRQEILKRVGPPMHLTTGVAASLAPDFPYMQLNCNSGKKSWTVLAKFAWKPEPGVSDSLSRFGLDPKTAYLAWDFWDSRFLGVVKDEVQWKKLNDGECQVVGLRPASDHPQVVGDDRHIGQGVVELKNETWSGGELKGEFLATSDQSWNIYVYVPTNWVLAPHQVGVVATEDPLIYKVEIKAGHGWKPWQASFVQSDNN